MSRSRIEICYEGRVQGVGFRYATKSLAGGFELTGKVRNLTDGRVEIIAEGQKKELKSFMQAIRESELGHFIKREEVKWADAQGGMSGFEIIR